MKVIIALGLLFAVVALATFLVGASLPATRRGAGATLTVREEATTSSPIGHIGWRLFFDPEAFAAAWLDELAREVARRRAQRGDA